MNMILTIISTRERIKEGNATIRTFEITEIRLFGILIKHERKEVTPIAPRMAHGGIVQKDIDLKDMQERTSDMILYAHGLTNDIAGIAGSLAGEKTRHMFEALEVWRKAKGIPPLTQDDIDKITGGSSVEDLQSLISSAINLGSDKDGIDYLKSMGIDFARNHFGLPPLQGSNTETWDGKKCPVCDGEGEIYMGKKCLFCEGSGKVKNQ